MEALSHASFKNIGPYSPENGKFKQYLTIQQPWTAAPQSQASHWGKNLPWNLLNGASFAPLKFACLARADFLPRCDLNCNFHAHGLRKR
jgi:hypothetical protein